MGVPAKWWQFTSPAYLGGFVSNISAVSVLREVGPQQMAKANRRGPPTRGHAQHWAAGRLTGLSDYRKSARRSLLRHGFRQYQRVVLALITGFGYRCRNSGLDLPMVHTHLITAVPGDAWVKGFFNTTAAAISLQREAHQILNEYMWLQSNAIQFTTVSSVSMKKSLSIL